MLKFEDERVLRSRMNMRSLRRMILRLTSKLPTAGRHLTPAFDAIAGDGNTFVTVCVSSSAETSDALTALRQRAASANLRKVSDKDLSFGQSPFDKPLTQYVKISREWLLEFCEGMLAAGYSLSYMRNMLTMIKHDAGPQFPLSRIEYRAFLRSIISNKTKNFQHRHKQSDGVYSMSERAYELMRAYCMAYLRAVVERGVGIEVSADTVVYQDRYNPRCVLFSYLYLMMYHTGKRISDICNLTPENLKCLLENGDIAVMIPKTERIGRISVARAEDTDNFRAFLAMMVRILAEHEAMRDALPFDQFRIRRQLNRVFKARYEKIMGSKKPNGLSFHSLRRRKAASFYKSGKDLETIRECLDHTDSRVTNVYINKHLLAESGNSGLAASVQMPVS